MITLILGSASPRRREILSLFKLPFTIISPPFDEEAHPYNGDPALYVSELSQGKSWAIPSTDPNTFVLTADTIVYRDGQLYEKPADREDARRMLLELCGKWHTVYTGVSLRKGNDIETIVDTTEVEFDTLNAVELENYLDKAHWQDKSGAYSIQDGGALLIKQIHGCYYNVKGLPLGALKRVFLKFGIDLWDYL